jgi:prophage antirepressor-like protein
MSNLKIFEKEEFGQVRTLTIDNEPWFIAKDICDALELSNPTMTIGRLDDDEVTKFNLGGLSGETNIVNEYGLYSLVLGSRKPEAKAFKRWITHEVIPAIRKHGMYATDDVLDQMLNDPDTMIKTLQAYKEERQKRVEAETKIEEMKPKALFADAVAKGSSILLISTLRRKQYDRFYPWRRFSGNTMT